MPTSKNVTVVLDLDDTLYSEQEYLRSGLRFILNSFREWLQKDIELSDDELMVFANPLDVLCEHLELKESIKQTMLWMYRLHKPEINLYPDAVELINYCKSKDINLAIITDGRVSTQSLKLQALNLLDVKSYISECFGELKPGLSRFVKVQSDLPSEGYIYVGDNPIKDFIAPNQLGWTTVGVSFRKGNIHTYLDEDLSDLQRPSMWVEDLSEIIKVIHEDINDR